MSDAAFCTEISFEISSQQAFKFTFFKSARKERKGKTFYLDEPSDATTTQQ